MKTTLKLVRVDNRLLHATVSLNWNQFINVNHTIVINPEYVNDPFIKKVMQLSLPESKKVKMFNIEQLIDFINEETNEIRNLMVIFKDLKTISEAVDAGFFPKEVQLPYPASRIVIKKLNDFFSEEEIRYIKNIQLKGVKLYFQTSPLDNKEYNIFMREECEGYET